MHRYGTKGRSWEMCAEYIWYANGEDPSREFHRKFRSRARQLAKKEIEVQLEDWYNDEGYKS